MAVIVGGRVNVPVILLTARGDEIDRIIGLEMGADDYLPKPFNPRELVARIQAVLRRKGVQAIGAPEGEEKTVNFNDFEEKQIVDRNTIIINKFFSFLQGEDLIA